MKTWMVAPALATLVGCAESRAPRTPHPEGCGTHIECYNRSLLILDQANQQLLVAQRQALDLVPPGTVTAFAGAVEPPGWLFCDGRVLAKGDPRYRRLFDAIGTAYGGDASPGFQIPDYRGAFLRGVDGGSGRDPEAATRTAMGRNGTGNAGAVVGSYQADALGAHAHAIKGVFLEANGGTGFDGHGFRSNSRQNDHDFGTRDAGGPETRPKNVAVNFLIKL